MIKTANNIALPCDVTRPGPRAPGRFARIRTAWDRWFQPIDIAPLVYFRLVFGVLMIWDLWRYTTGHQLRTVFIEPEFHFKYYGFGWVPTLPGDGMYGLATVLLLSAAGITTGLYYRICAPVFAVGFTWLFLSEAAHYLNHFYLICLLSFVAILLPANRSFSLDVLRNPSLRTDVAPAWTLWLLRAQFALVYFYGGLAKINGDWLAGEPVRTWLSATAQNSVFGPVLRTEWAVGIVAYGGLLLDLGIVPLLLWRRTRNLAFALVVAFHLLNNYLFSIGVFPWLGIALSALFFPPEAPRKWLARLGFATPKSSRPVKNLDQGVFRYRRSITAVLAVYLAWQLLMPLRHLAYPGNVSWTEEGHRFAWHMKLRTKAGHTVFFVRDPRSGEVSVIDPQSFLTQRQIRKMSGHPDMILQFAHHISHKLAAQGLTNLHVHAIANVTLNGRPPALLIDPNVNLATVPRGLPPRDWILPLGHNHPGPSWLADAQMLAVGSLGDATVFED